MTKLLENRGFYFAFSVVFALALGLNILWGGPWPNFTNALAVDLSTLKMPADVPLASLPRLAHGPTLPPDPWEVRLAHGPTFPPSPWDVRVALLLAGKDNWGESRSSQAS